MEIEGPLKMSNGAKPLFVDLFYAVVVGSAITLILPTQKIDAILVQIFLMVVVLEDWYAYYRHVLPVHSIRGTDIGFFSLMVEFGILLSWYLAFTSVPDHIETYLKMFALFFGIRIFAGMVIYRKKGTVVSKGVLRDFVFFLAVGSAISLLVLRNWGWIDDGWIHALLVGAWILQTAAWWLLPIEIERTT
jgi:hypothetical protein